MIKIYPVIHHLNDAQAMREAFLAMSAGCDGVFLISRLGKNDALLPLAKRIQQMEWGGRLEVGVNLLGVDPEFALRMAHFFGLDLVWMDNAGVHGTGLDPIGQRVAARLGALGTDAPLVFAGTAFKYQPNEPYPAGAAHVADCAGFIPTTSGPGTGEAPMLDKIKGMHAPGKALAVASGMTVENVADFAPYLSHILVATGVSIDEHHFDFERLLEFVARAREA